MKTHAERRNQIAFADKRFSSASRRLAFELLEARLHLSAGPDVFETDNDCDHASSISIGGTAQAHSIHEATDVDWVRFTLTQVSRVTLETGGAAGDTKLWLFRSGQCGWSEAISYDYDSGVGYFSKIEEYLEPGDYFAAVTEEGQSTTIESYTLTVTAVGLANKKDAYEDDNTVQAAQPIVSGATQVHSLHVPYDVDWVTFSVSQASRATLTATGGAGRVALRLFGPNDPARQISYDYYPDGAVLAEVVVYLQPGVYHASVGSYYQDGALDGYALGLNLVPLTDLDDGFEPDNEAANATQLFLDGTPQPHSIHQPSDVDWTTFQLAAPARVAIETDGLEGDTWMALYASTNLNTPIATDFDSGNGEFSRIVAFLDPGTYYVRVQESYQDATIDSYILSAVSVALADLDDDFEDDGTSAAAKQIQANAPAQEHSIHRPTDVDWCWFTITAPSRVILETEGPEGDTWMELYASGNLSSYIASDDSSGNGEFSRIVAYLEPGTYYVKTQEYYQDATIDRYTLSLQTTLLADLADAYEEDGTSATAKQIQANGPAQEHSIHRPTDVDWCWFTITAPSRVILETEGPEGDTWMELYASGNLSSYIASDDSSGNGEFSRIVAYLEPGNYRVKVQEYNRDATIDRYTLSLQATLLDALKDAYEDDNLSATAHVIATNGVPEVHNIHHPGDVDWFKFHLAAASRVTLETDGPDGNTWMALYAAGALETPIASDSYSGNGDFSRIVQYHLDAGDYYVRVQENWQDATIARYTMSVTATPLTALRDAREVDDSPSASSPLVATDGTPQPRTLHEPSDVDWARFTLAAASNVVIATDGSSGDTQMWLFGPGNWTTQIAYDNHSGKDAFARISASLGAGTYYVKISEYGQNEPVDDYAVSVFAVPQANPRDAYEADDSAAQAVLIPADGSRRAHNFHNGADVDWVKFDVLAPSKVVVETDGANGDTQLRLFASGSYDWSDPLAYDDDGGYGDFSRIVAYLAPGRYYAAASECGQNNPIDHFTLAVTATAVDALKDASENPGDDTAAGATMLVPESTIQARTLHEPTDVDWFRFCLGNTSLVTLTTISEIDEYSASTQVSLFGPDNSTTLMTSRHSSGVNLDIQRVLAAGTYFVRVEERGNNAGIAQYAIGLSAAPLGDLVPEDGWLSSSLSVGLGETITVHWTARNNGPGTTDPYQQGYEYWYDEVYLSLDDQLDSSDRYLGYRRSDSDPLDAQDQYVASRSVTIPNDTDWAGRDAYILVVIDSDADLDETDETNNILAIHIQTENYIELLAPYVGRYLDVSTPTEFRWLACDTQPGAVVSLAIDEDADPSNGSYQWILLNEPVSDQNVVETATVTISDVTPRTEPYYIWAAVTDSQGTTYSEPVAVLVAERAYGSGRVTSDPVGGNRYSVAGIEAAEVAGQYYIRVRTSYPPDKGRGGDLHIVVGDTVFGLCVHSHTIADGTRVIAGDLYQEAEFLMGTCVSSVPTFIDSYTTHIPGKSSVQVIETPDENWGYEIIATIDTDVLTSSAVASTTSSEESAEFCAGWSMYCGNDTDRVCVPEDKPDLAVRAFSYDSENNTAELSYSISGEEIASTSTVAVFWATGSTADDIIDSAIFQSPTESIPGEYGPITVPATSLQSRPGEATHLIAIIDPDGSVDEQDEDNNLRSVSIALEDPAPEILAREVAYRNWIDDSTNPQSIGYGDYVVDEVISGAGFYTIGLVRSETSSPSRRDPILVFRGTNVSNWEDRLASIFTDLNPEGIGYDKFVSYKSEVVSWVEQYVGETVDLIGHSLGGALAQWFAVDLTSALGIQIGHVYTYNSPGIGEDEAKSFVSSLCEGVVHSVVNGDVVSLAGEAFIQGTVNLYSYDDWNPLAKHRRPVEVKECNGLKRPTAAENFTVENISVEELSGDWFFYDDLEYVSCLAGAQATLIAGDIVDGLGEWYNDNVKYLPAKLFFRKTTEDARRELGAAIYEFLEVDPKTTNLVIDSIYLHSGWELRNVEIDWHNIATGSLEIKAGLKFPTVGVGLDLKPLIIGVQVGVAGGELTTLGAYTEGIQEPLPYGIFLQEISAAVEHFAESDPNPLTVCGGIGFSYGPEFEVTFPNNFVVENLRGERYEFSLASLNGEVSADRDKFEMSGELSVLDESIIHGTGELSYDWSKGLLHGSATLDVLYGLMGGFAANIVARAIGGVYTFSAQGSATISIPDEIPTIGGSILGSGIGGIFCNNDGNFGNDHIYVKVETSFFHKVFVVGFDLYLDGEYDVKFGFGPWSPSTEAACGISAMEAASDANGSSTTMLFVEWENDVPNARAALILPDGTRITEDDISTRSDIELVEILCTSRRRVFAVQSDPETVDLWTVELSGVTGTVTRSLYAENAAPTFSFDAVSGGGTAPLSIDYTLHDSDSMPSVRFFLDTDKTGADGVPISDWLGVSDVPYLTIPKDIASDTYYLYAEITDEYHVSSIQYNATAIAVVTEPCLVINETAAVFATRATDTTETEVCVFTIENQGTAALEIADITQYTNDLSAFQVAVVGHDGTSLHGDGLSIPSGGQSQIVVTFVGSRAGQKQMSIEFSTNDPAIAALSLDVTGSVVEPQVWTTINVENDDPVTIAISDLANVDHGLSGHTISLVTCRSLFTTHGTLLQTEDQLVFSPDETFGREATFTYVLMDNTGASCECGIRVINSNAASSVDISAVIVAERTVTGTDGETDTLPDSVDWLDEWASYWVEIWISTPESDTLSVASAVVDLFYDTSCFSPKRIEYGPAFTENQTATIDDAVGVIHGLGAATAATGVSDDRYVLLARVEFDSLLPGDAAGVLVVPEQYVSAAPCGVELAGGQVALAGDVAADVELGPAPTTELWPVMYDVDNNGEVGLGDLSFFAAAYRHTVGEAGSSHTYACDFDLNGEVGLGDLSYFAAAYRHKHTDSEPMIYSDSDPLFPDDWRFVSAPSAAVAAMEQSGAAFLAGETENDTRGTALERSLCDAVLAESHDWVARQIVFQADRVTWPCAFARHSVSKRTTRLPAPDSPAIFLPSGSSCPSGKRV